MANMLFLIYKKPTTEKFIKRNTSNFSKFMGSECIIIKKSISTIVQDYIQTNFPHQNTLNKVSVWEPYLFFIK